MFNLSVVNIVEEQHLDIINSLAAAYGCGENNLSVKLQDVEGNTFYGCHAWWHPDDYGTFTDQESRQMMIESLEDPSATIAALENLYERLVLDGNAQENWQAALTELGLMLVEESQS